MRRTSLAALITLALALPATAKDGLVPVPEGRAPVLDGSLGAEEWRNARRVGLSPEGEALLLRDDDALYVGVRVGRDCIPSLAVVHGERVYVLHASASLGTAVYERRDEAWSLLRGFEWRCRDGRASDEERARFLADEGWIATTIGTGSKGEAEYRIERSLLDGDAPLLAVIACRLRPGPPSACAWPAAVADTTTDLELLMGSCPRAARFELDAWARLDPGPTAKPGERLDAGLDDVEKAEDPVAAYVHLLDLIAEYPEAGGAVRKRANALVQALERRKEVRGEAKANRVVQEVMSWIASNEDRLAEPAVRTEAIRRLRRVEDAHPGTRAARLAAQRREEIEKTGTTPEPD